jgi:7-cyano-7-deazaguanine synthase
MSAHAVSKRLHLLSGGIDSAVALAMLRSVDGDLGLFIDYGQSAAAQERRAASAIASHYGIALTCVAAPLGRFQLGEIRGRNAFLLASAVMWAPRTVSAVVIGIHGDTPYRDCSPSFVQSFQNMVDEFTNGEIRVVAPLAQWRKPEVLQQARELGVPLDLTYSCEVGAGSPCGACNSCKDAALC